MSRCRWVLATTAVMLAVSSGTAAAAPGLERAYSPPRAPDSTRSKSATATCPFGKRVLGAGAEINGGRGRVVMDHITPDGTLRSVTAGATEDPAGTSNQWTVTAYAICAAPVPGLELIPATTGPSASNQNAVATCPAGKRVVGAGGELIAANGRIVMSRITPDRALTRVTVVSLEDAAPTVVPWSVRAYAICAAPLARLTRIEVHSDLLNPSNPSSASATCPSGTRVVGAGGEIVHNFLDDVGDALLEGDHLLDDLTPNQSLTGVTVTGYDGPNAWGEFHAIAVAICAVPPGALAPAPPQLPAARA